MTSLSRTSNPYGSRRTSRHAELRRKQAGNAQVESTFEAVNRMFNRGTHRGLNVFGFARLLGRARALRALAALPNWEELHVLLHALVALIQRAVRDEYDRAEGCMIAPRTRPRIIRPQVHAGVEPRTAASF
ncbi:hypothetical protein GCM10010840_35680 [Deinococcus aerolatus]|uniref:Transposase DDE domain-containing protein n=1 Tax=Deinococcus aerolatus TaxID=522487 RepID=A0ABQ2GGT4_9DEIO|nr:hypothetical protein [Deinococcus aerolatus]GGL94508.1 hypothetical protein GCM10010840_35680 [Deinococcus aerolatus]